MGKQAKDQAGNAAENQEAVQTRNSAENQTAVQIGNSTENQEAAQTEEMFVSGFCKMQNQTRMVICEMEERPDGTRKLVETDCAYGRCEHTGDCLLMRQIR